MALSVPTASTGTRPESIDSTPKPPAARLGLLHFVKIDQRAPAQPPGFLDRHHRFEHTRGDLTAGMEFEKRVHLALSDRRAQGLRLRAEPVGGNHRDLAQELIRVSTRPLDVSRSQKGRHRQGHSCKDQQR